MKSLAIIITHPIQYYVPLFKELAKQCILKVYYTWGEEGANKKYDPGFRKTVDWDLPLLKGYAYQFIANKAKKPGSHHFNGIVNPDLIEQVKTFKPDSILVYGWSYQSHLKVLRYFKGKIPICFRGDSNLIDEQKGLKKILRHLFLRWVYGHIDVALYVGTANKLYYEKLGLKPHQLRFAPHAIDNDRFAVDRSIEASALRTSLNIAKKDILILFAGKFETKKNPELLLKAFIEVSSSVVFHQSSVVHSSTLNEQRTKNKQRPNLHLLFVGNGELEDSLKLKVESLKILRQVQDDSQAQDKNEMQLQDNKMQYSQDRFLSNFGMTKTVHFMDFQNQTQMPVVYQACDLFCLPSQGPGETWGLAVNEAMAAGKAILVSDKVGCAVDLVTKETGFIFRSNDIDDLKQKLIALTEDKTTLVERGKSAQEHIQNWSFGQQVKAILKYVNS